MDAKMNSISPILPDVNLRPEKTLVEPKTEKGPSFNSVLDRAQKSEPKTEPKTKAVSKVDSKAEPARANTVNQKTDAVETPVPQQPMKVVKTPHPEAEAKSETKGIDDKAGVIAQSYDGTAVSYPMSKIARESLDEKTVTKLKEAGLWDLPTLVMAQPSQQLMTMKELGTELKGQDTFPMAKPIAQFMASLENELGIEPDRLVQAFQQLPAGQLSEAPEKTMGQVVKNLGLNPKDEARATALFSKMLSQMKAMENESLNPALLAMAGVAGANVPTSQLGEKIAPPVEEKASLKGKAQIATSRYAQTSGQASGPENVLASRIANPTDASSVVKDDSLPFKSPAKGNLPTEAKVGSTPTDLTKPVVTSSDNQGIVAVPAQMNPVESQSTVVQASHAQAPDVFAANTMSAHQNVVEDKSVKEIVRGVKDSKETLTVKGATQTPGSVTQVASQPASPLAKPDVAGGAVTGGGIANAELKAGNDSKHEAIRSIVNQAQMLAQKGGGEIRMTLRPDHLGEIQLKVAMEGNRVNVSMTAERGEVKKLIEQSVHELRHGLATHNLSMDKLDVSVSQRDTSGFKGQPDFGAAKDFANQFHQQQNNKREMMEDLSSMRGNALKSMATMDRSSQAQKFMGTRGSGRLNVVA